MAFCKVCVCGEKIVFQRIMSFPDNCPVCGRRLQEFRTYPEDDPQVETLLQDARRHLEESAVILQSDPDLETKGFSDEEIITEAQIITQPQISMEPRIITQPEASSERVPDYFLRLSNGKIITIPKAGCIIGRTETGAEELAEFGSVSRQHLRVSPKRHGVVIEDLSTYGTIADGKRLERNIPVSVNAGAKLVLCDLEAELFTRPRIWEE